MAKVKQKAKDSSKDIFREVFQALDYYMQKEPDIKNIPKILIENYHMIRKNLVYYLKHPIYWIEMQKLTKDIRFYGMKPEDVLQYCKYTIVKNNLNPYDKMYISRSKFKTETDTPEFKEFSKYLDAKTNYMYSEDEKKFIYEVILTEEERLAYIPSKVKKFITKGKKKAEALKEALKQEQKLKDKKLILFLSNQNIKLDLLKHLFKPFDVELMPIDTPPEAIINLKPQLIVGLDKEVFSELSDQITNNSMKFFQYKYDQSITVTTMPLQSTALNKYIDNIKNFMKTAIQAKAIINTNSIDMSKKSNQLEKLTAWSQVLDLVRQGWKISTTQMFKNDFEFKNPLALMSFVNEKTGEKKYFNVNDLDYVYYVYEHDVTPDRGIEPLESLDNLTKKTMTMYEFMTQRYKKFQNVETPRLFEADISVADKLMSYAKEYCRPHFDDVNDIISTKPKVAYLDIEVYMDEGFEQPENARKEVNAFAYSLGDSTHVDIYLLTDTPMEKKYDLIDKFLKDAKQSVRDAKERGAKIQDSVIERIDNYTYELHTVSSEYELLKTLDDLIIKDQPDVLTAWNIWFDINYLINRAKLMNYQDITFSPLGIRGYISSQDGMYSAPGIDTIDMLEGWKSSLKGAPKSAKLNYAGYLELGLLKIEHDGDLCKLYDEDKVKYAGYNQFDVIIFKEIDIKKQILLQKMFYRQVTGCATTSVDSTIKSVDTVSTEFARKKNLALRNHTYLVKKDKAYKGALTIARQVGIHLLVTDLDQTSQYPSMMQTFNLSSDTLEVIIDAEYETLYRYIHEKRITQQQLNQEVKVTFKPLTWYGGDKLGYERYMKLGEALQLVKEKDLILTVTGACFTQHYNKVGFYFELLSTFRDFRNKFKAQMKQAHKNGDDLGKLIYNNLQLAMKILINSVYGCTGTDSYRFFHVAISETITTMARTEISVVAANLEKLILEWEHNLENDIIKIEKLEKETA